MNATIRLILKTNITNVSYCDTTITVNSAIWKTYTTNLIVPDNVVLSDINLLANNIGTGNFVAISNVQLYKGDKVPTTRIRDTTITVKQTVSFSAQSGCSNYKWSTGETTQNIVFDGAKSGPGTFPISYTADDPAGVSISDNCTITVNGLFCSPGSFSFPAQSASGTLKITANIPWTITSKKLKTTLNPLSGTGTTDINVSMADNVSTLPVDDTLTITSSQTPITISVHQAGYISQLLVSQNIFNNILKTGTTESVQITSTAIWKVSSKPTWVSVSPSIGNGNGTMTFKVDSNKLATVRTGNIVIKSPNGVSDSLSVTISLTQSGTSPFFIIPSTDHITIGPTNGDTASIAVSSNIKWKIISSISWMTTNPAAWITIDSDKKILITLDTKYLSTQDLTGTDIQGSFTLEEDSSLPTRIIKTVGVTLKAIPALLSLPSHTLTFKGIESATIDIQSNLPWSTEKRSAANWLAISPSFSAGNATMKIDCIAANTSSIENSVYLLIYQTKGVLKDSILLKQAASPLGINDYEHSGIKIYPQPAVETLNIDLPDNYDLKYWDIYNPMGVELLKGRIETKNKVQIPIARLASGVYFIVLSSDSKKIGLKFTK